ncbi:MAG: transglutaminase domain-containing protein [Nitrospirae bacterium]|nr:MAG: transglutaminase domain-containing protein [Nitrospirota bacterium]
MEANSIRIETVVKALTYAVCVLAFAMVARAAGLSYALIFLGLLTLSIYFERHSYFAVPRWLLNLIAVAFVVITFFRVSLADPVTPVLQMLLIMVGIKLLEKKGFRDFMQIYLLSVFLLAGSALVSIDMDFLAALIIMMYLLSTAIVFLTYYAQDASLEVLRPAVRRMLVMSLLIPTIAVPLSLLLFIILPRSTFPLMTFLNRGGVASTGFSEQVSLGDVAGIQEDASIAFRAEMPRIADHDLYWRGLVLDTFDGKKWTRSTNLPEAVGFLETHARTIPHIIYLEPYQNRYLFALDRPVSVSLTQARISRDLTITLPAVFERRIRYEAVSAPVSQSSDLEVIYEKYLQLPELQWDEVRSLTSAVVGNAKGHEAAAAIARYLRESGVFSYKLSALPLSDDPVHAFLFQVRAGNCEYFASVMAVMLRMIDVPARLVGGYRGGYYSEIAGYYAVPQKSAHVWVEAFIPGRGWVRFDPTPASSESFSEALERSFALRIRMLIDYIQYAWNAFVVNYDFQMQVQLFKSIRDGARKLDIRVSLDRKVLVITGACLLALGLAGGGIWHLKNRKRPEQRLLEHYFRQMQRFGYIRQPGEGLSEMTSRIIQSDLRTQAVRFVELYQRCFYREGFFAEKAVRELGDILEIIEGIQYDI